MKLGKPNENMDWRYQSLFHNHWMIRIKNETGASYCSWEQDKNKYNLLIRLTDVNGKKRTKRIPVEGTPSDVTPESYKNLLKLLTDGRE